MSFGKGGLGGNPYPRLAAFLTETDRETAAIRGKCYRFDVDLRQILWHTKKMKGGDVVDTKMDLRPPIRRSWLRLRLGKAYYTGKRYLLWCSPKYRWAKTRKEERLPCVQFSHATPLMRHLRGEEMVWQENKVTNLKLAVKRLDGLILYPGETFSYWKRIGKPTARKGYKEGMVLFLGQIGGDIGGGLCQLSNLIFWMTLHTPLTVTERYRHSHDVFPDANRTQPFGSGATCAYPHRDLMIRNDTDRPYQLCLRVGETHLEGAWRSTEPPALQFRVIEKDARIDQASWGGYIRHNQLWREVYGLSGALLEEQYLCTNDAIMMYSPLLSAAPADGE